MIDEKLAKSIYDYLTKYCVGEENAISGRILSRMFGMDRRVLRDYIHALRNSTKIEKIIGSSNKGYYICRKEAEFEAADRRLERQALSTLKVLWANRKKRSKDGQFTLSFDDYVTQKATEAFGE